jgi:hypothetical protein
MFALYVAASSAIASDQEVITKNSEGREFWVVFMKNFREAAQRDGKSQENLRLQLFITSSYDATVRIRIEELDYDNTITIRANAVVPVQIPARAQLRLVEQPERLAVHVTADTTVSVYGLNSRYQTTDTFLGLPIQVLGKEYRAVGYTKLSSDLLSALSIVATEDETDVTITPTVTTSTGRPAGVPFTVRLRKGDVYSVGARWESIGQCDLTGTLITSSKNVAVFSGHNCAYVPPKIDACNHLVEQLPPVSAWGKHYYLGMLKERSKYTFRVIASQNQTKVFEDSRLVAVMRAGEFYENLNVSRHVQITADKPVLVAQFAQGFKNGDSVGDPMMILVSPTQQFLNEYRIATPIRGDWHHYINLVAPTSSIQQIRLNGRKIDSVLFAVLGESRYSIAQVPIPFGSHVIRSETPFGLYSYGFGFKSDAYDAYGNMAGQSFIELKALADSLPPVADGKRMRDDFVVTMRDDRPTDKGLRNITVMSSGGLSAQIPKIDEGAPQVAIRIRQSVGGQAGRIVLRAEDVAGNKSDFTVCYVFDSRSERYTYMLNEGSDVLCASEGAWMVGAFFSTGTMFHDVDVRMPSVGIAQTPFNQASIGSFAGGGALIGRRVAQDLVLNARLGLTSIGGTLLSPDSTITPILDSISQRVTSYQQATTLHVTSPLVQVSVGIEWFPHRYFYLSTGVHASLLLGSSAEIQRTILRPSNWTYPDGERTQNVANDGVDNLTSFNYGVYGGLGFSYPVSFRASLFAEAMYTQWITSMSSDGTWTSQRFGLNVGLRFRL